MNRPDITTKNTKDTKGKKHEMLFSGPKKQEILVNNRCWKVVNNKIMPSSLPSFVLFVPFVVKRSTKRYHHEEHEGHEDKKRHEMLF